MKLVVERVSSATCIADGKITGQISRGLLILLGAEKDDGREDVLRLAKKCMGLRIFEDIGGKMNLSAADICGEILVISNFTLAANSKRGNRPSFENALPPQQAQELYDLFVKTLRELGASKVEAGKFGAHMEIESVKDGPVTILLD